jgi:hypothetical protein
MNGGYADNGQAYGQPGYGQPGYNQNGYGVNGGYANNGQAYGQPGYGQPGNYQNGYGMNGGYTDNGQGYGQNGYNQGGYGVNNGFNANGSQVPGPGGFMPEGQRPGPGGFMPNNGSYQQAPGGFPQNGRPPKKHHGLLIVLILLGVATLATLAIVFIPSGKSQEKTAQTSSSSNDNDKIRGKWSSGNCKNKKDSKEKINGNSDGTDTKKDISGRFSKGSSDDDNKTSSSSSKDQPGESGGKYTSHVDEITGVWQCSTETGGKVIFYTNADGSYSGFIDVYFPDANDKDKHAIEWAIGPSSKDENTYEIVDDEGKLYQVVAVGTDDPNQTIAFAVVDFDKDPSLADEKVVTMQPRKIDDSFKKLLRTMEVMAGV